jgi:N-acetylglucosamine-6-phosphate deacetylase
MVALGGMSPGLYETPVGGLVELTHDGCLSLDGTPFLAGSVVPLKDAVAHMAKTHLSLSESLRLATQNPARFLGRTGRLQVGAPADLVRFTWKPDAGIQIESLLLQGTRIER